jgi:hypothetical protein
MHDGLGFDERWLTNKARGQCFTPYDLCRAMAEMTIGNDLTEKIQAKGFITASEPACGSGAMIIALAETMQSRGINYQQRSRDGNRHRSASGLHAGLHAVVASTSAAVYVCRQHALHGDARGLVTAGAHHG